jgi:hypothetical protein
MRQFLEEIIVTPFHWYQGASPARHCARALVALLADRQALGEVERFLQNFFSPGRPGFGGLRRAAKFKAAGQPASDLKVADTPARVAQDA